MAAKMVAALPEVDHEIVQHVQAVVCRWTSPILLHSFQIFLSGPV